MTDKYIEIDSDSESDILSWKIQEKKRKIHEKQEVSVRKKEKKEEDKMRRQREKEEEKFRKQQEKDAEKEGQRLRKQQEIDDYRAYLQKEREECKAYRQLQKEEAELRRIEKREEAKLLEQQQVERNLQKSKQEIAKQERELERIRSKRSTTTTTSTSTISSRKVPLISAPRNNEKKWSVSDFEDNRPAMTEWTRSNIISPFLSAFDLGTHEVSRVLVHGQVKVGKREIVEYIAMRDLGKVSRVHVFISSFHRVADKSQREELENHNLVVCSVNNKQKCEETLKLIKKLLTKPSTSLVVHWDECDYGTGDKQNLCKIYTHLKDECRVFHILYSATPEELIYSKEISKHMVEDWGVEGTEVDDARSIDGDLVENGDDLVTQFSKTGVVRIYTPPEGYCGAAKFLQEDLVQDASPFFCRTPGRRTLGYELSEQGRQIILGAKANLREINRRLRSLEGEKDDAEERGDPASVIAEIDQKISDTIPRFIVVLRITYNNGETQGEEDTYMETRCNNSHKAFHTFHQYWKTMPELKDVDVYFDKPDDEDLDTTEADQKRVRWGDHSYWRKNYKQKVALIVHDQTSTRSTEWGIHDMVFATHDYRKRIIFNTVAQAQLRSAHYAQKYGGFQPIAIYGHLKTFQLCAKMITVAQYIENDWSMRKIPSSEPPRYRLKHLANQPVPEEFGGEAANIAGFTNTEAKRVMALLGCHTNVGSKMSQRVRGKCGQAPIIKHKFYAVPDPTDRDFVQSIIEHVIKIDPDFAEYGVREKIFQVSAYFNENKKEKDEDGEWTGKWVGTFRKQWKIFFYEDLCSQRWGMDGDTNTIRLTECYLDETCETVGLCLRVNTGEMQEVDTLVTHGSMYSKGK